MMVQNCRLQASWHIMTFRLCVVGFELAKEPILNKK
jgi:hypothetical protein